MLIDDGSHMSSDVVNLLRCTWPRLGDKFIYIIEDCDSLGNPGYSQHMATRFKRSEADNQRVTFLGLINDLMDISDKSNAVNESIHISYCNKLLWISRWGDYSM